MTTKLRVCALSFAAVIGSRAPAVAAELDGLWIESNNYPASSVLRFKEEGGFWTGRYSQVSAMQRDFGFAVGEAVIRGKFDGRAFKGEVLLKPRDGEQNTCAALAAGWKPIEMSLVEDGRLYGAWLQTYTRKATNCEIVGYKWQVYGLERLKLN